MCKAYSQRRYFNFIVVWGAKSILNKLEQLHNTDLKTDIDLVNSFKNRSNARNIYFFITLLETVKRFYD